jgi:hypothetical protein
MTELSDEMKEAIRILREDGQMAAFNKLSKSHQEMITRFDEVENNWSEFRAAQKEKETLPTEPTDSGKTGNSETDPEALPNSPEPPPVIEPEPVAEKAHRPKWWERGGYASD